MTAPVGPEPDDHEADRPAVTGAPVGGGRREAITGDDTAGDAGGNAYPADGASPDRGGSAPRD